MDAFDYQHWLAVAGRFSRRPSDAADLLQDSLLDALRVGRIDFTDVDTQRWFAGVIRNRAAMAARGEGRRKRRETAVAQRDRVSVERSVPSPTFVESLPPSARRVAVLVVAGLNRDEIVAALQLAPTAFRQRLTTIRKSWMKLPRERREALSIDGPSHVNGIGLGPLRRALLANVQRLGGVGTHDPDGHLIVLSDSHSHPRASRQQKGKENRHG